MKTTRTSRLSASRAATEPKVGRQAPGNARALAQELQWFTQVLDTRLKLYFGQESAVEDIRALPPPQLEASDYRDLVEQLHLGFDERIALMLALTPHLNPRLLDVFFTKNATFDRPFTEFGGYTHPRHQGFLPTGETLAFLLASNDLDRRLRVLELFAPTHPFARQHLLELDQGQESGPPLTGALKLAPEYLHRLSTGQEYRPDFGANFPAYRIETRQEWNDLVLPAATLEQIREISAWIQYGPTLLDDWGMRRALRPGLRCLFYGPSGTGKTMTACLLGKSTGRPVYKVDLSLVVSKYIGETEKNLAKVFDQAESRGWILFFDEADALFGKRTEVRDAHDRYANQEVSFLLQRVETFDGIVILASNLRDNLDSAFTRRFESLIYFPLPRQEERQRLWQQSFPPKAALAPELDLPKIAAQYELSGGGILNAVRYACLRALEDGGTVQAGYVLEGIRREYAKEGRGG